VFMRRRRVRWCVGVNCSYFYVRASLGVWSHPEIGVVSDDVIQLRETPATASAGHGERKRI